MKLSELFPCSFKALRCRMKPSDRRPMVALCRSDDSGFCREAVARGWLSAGQMARAAERYRLGRSRSGKTVFWMIDGQGTCRDGHIADAVDSRWQWVSRMLKARYPALARHVRPEHCLFGLHLLSEGLYSPVGIVESERSAVILSELYPGMLWMATVCPANLSAHLLAPLLGRKVTLFPPTDPDGSTFLCWLDTADRARRQYGLDIAVSTVLEDNASPVQRQQCADLVDYIFEQTQSNQQTESDL